MTLSEWNRLLDNVSTDLENADIKPGPQVEGKGESQVAGSTYFSSRCEGMSKNVDFDPSKFKVTVTKTLDNQPRVTADTSEETQDNELTNDSRQSPT